MKRLGTLQGIGTLAISEEHFGDIRYRIDVWLHSRGAKSGSGVLAGAGDALNAGFNAGDVVLHLENGESVKIMVSGISGGHAEIKTNGPVPGF